MKDLIVYFSRNGENYVNGKLVQLDKGNTEVAAEMLRSITGGDSFKIVMVKPYAKDYMTCIQQAKVDLESDARPELATDWGDVSAYNRVFLGYPNYWGTMPMAVRTFLEQHDFKNQIIYPLCTHEGSGMGSSERDLKKLCPTALIAKGLAIHGGSVNKAGPLLVDWVDAATANQSQFKEGFSHGTDLSDIE